MAREKWRKKEWKQREREKESERELHLLKLNIFSSARGRSRPGNVLFIPTSQRNINQL